MTLTEIEEKREMIPICASCKQVRDNKGYWHKVDSLIHKHKDTVFTHSICPDCIKKLYPDHAEKIVAKMS